MAKNLINEKLYIEVKSLVEKSRKQVVSQVNNILTITYWTIRKILKENVFKNNRAQYGEETLEKLGKKLTYDYGNGFSRANLTRIIKFYESFSDREIVATLSHKFSWSHFLKIIKYKKI